MSHHGFEFLASPAEPEEATRTFLEPKLKEIKPFYSLNVKRPKSMDTGVGCLDGNKIANKALKSKENRRWSDKENKAISSNPIVFKFN